MRTAAASSVETPQPPNRQPRAALDANTGPRPAHSLVTPRMPQPPSEELVGVDEAYPEPKEPDSESEYTQLVGSPIQADGDNEEIDEPLDVMRPPSPRRSRQQTSTLPRAGSRQLDRRLEDMIANEKQCNVRSESRPPARPVPRPPAPSSSERPVGSAPPDQEPLEPDLEYSMSSPGSDNNTSDMADFGNELRELAESSSISLRYASAPGGIRKYTVDGFSLRYQRATDAAMRAQTIVRNRPRMRRRSKTRHVSNRSSAAQSLAAPSAALPYPPSAECPP
ncbi:hypothetical protein VTH06DRAFT_6213 [Thermothelomyces fergusii]